jgi:hypothetical protein
MPTTGFEVAGASYASVRPRSPRVAVTVAGLPDGYVVLRDGFAGWLNVVPHRRLSLRHG